MKNRYHYLRYGNEKKTEELPRPPKYQVKTPRNKRLQLSKYFENNDTQDNNETQDNNLPS